MNTQSAPTVLPLDRAMLTLRERAAALLAHVRETVARRDVPDFDDIAQLDSRMRRDIGVEAAFFPRVGERRDAHFPRL